MAKGGRRWAAEAAVAAAASILYAPTVVSRDFVWDDRYVIGANPLLRSWASLPRLLTTGYWEGVFGATGHDAHYRPILMLSYFLTYQAAGAAPWAFHLGNLALHALNCVLLFRLLRRWYGEGTAGAAALLFAFLPIHSESVGYISGRPELLTTTWLLLAWSDLSGAEVRLARGLGFYILALLTQEQAVMFAPIIALFLRTFGSQDRAPRGSLRASAGVFACAGAYVLLRFLILAHPFHTSVHFFEGRTYLEMLLTMSRFVFTDYLAPMASGLRLRMDYSRPVIADASARDLGGWLCFAAGVGLLAEAGRRIASGLRGARAGFWLWSAFLFLLPVSNLILPFNVPGAQRYLYFPSIGFCVLAAQTAGLARSPAVRRACLAGLAAWYGALAARANRRWVDEENFYGAWARENPRSAEAMSGLGVLAARQGRIGGAVRGFEAAMALDPGNPEPYYNLGRLRYEHGDLDEAERLFLSAVRRSPGDADTWMFLGAVSERRGRLLEAAERYGRVLRLRPWDPNAHFNIGRVLMASGRDADAAAHLREYLRLDPGAADAAQVRALLPRIEDRSRR